MSQSRFSIVLVGVSALLRRPLVSRLRPADGERSPWVVFTARGGRFDSGFRSAGWPSGSPLPLFGMPRFGVAAGRVRSSAFRFGNCPQRVGLRAHGFRFSARTASEWPLGRLTFGLIASAFRDAPFRRLPLGGLAFGLTASAFRHAPLRSCRSAGWPSGSLLPLFGMHRFGVAARRVGLRASVSEIAARRVGLRAHGFRFSARTDPHRRAAEARTDGAHRHDTCFTSKHLSQHVNLPHRSPQALQNRQTPLLSPTRHPRGRRPHAHHRAHREEVHPGFGRREGRGRRTRG